MFVLTSKSGQPVVALAKKTDAELWSERFGWSVHEVPNGDETKPIRLRTGFISLLEPTRPPSYREPFVSFLPEEQQNFPDPTKVQEGDIFFKSNLENVQFSLPEDEDPNERALVFWNKLHERGLDLQRQVNDKFRAIRIAGRSEISSESPDVAKLTTSRTIELSAANIVAAGDKAVGVVTPPSSGDPRLRVDPRTQPLPPGTIVESHNGNPTGN